MNSMDQVQDHPNISRNIHPPVLLLIHVLAAFLLHWLLPPPFGFPKFLEWVGYVLVFSGLGFAFSAVSQFGKVHTTLDPHGSVSAVVTSGVYRFSRNPIYLGFVCTLIGLPLALGNVWGAVLSPLLMVSLYQLVIKHEEAYLEEKFKDVYTSYRSRVRRWL
jgi:protein-S-isoprenylcysteine O-methyltransferase Ste14